MWVYVNAQIFVFTSEKMSEASCTIVLSNELYALQTFKFGCRHRLHQRFPNCGPRTPGGPWSSVAGDYCFII